MHKFKWEVRYTKLVIDYATGGEKLVEIIEDVRVCKGVELSTDHCFLSIRLSYQQRGVNEQNLKRRANISEEKFKVPLLNEGYMQWLYEKRMDDCLKHYEDKTNVENEWDNKGKIYYGKQQKRAYGI